MTTSQQLYIQEHLVACRAKPRSNQQWLAGLAAVLLAAETPEMCSKSESWPSDILAREMSFKTNKTKKAVVMVVVVAMAVERVIFNVTLLAPLSHLLLCD